MQKVFNVAVDIGRKLPAPAFEVNTNDLKSVKLIITIINGQTLLDLTDTTVRIAIRKPDSHIIFQDCTVKDATGGQVEIILENQAYTMPGTHTAEIMCYKGSEVVAVSGTFSYKSTKGIMNDEAVESKSEFTVINQKIEEAKKLLEDALESGVGVDEQARQDIQEVSTQLENTSEQFLNVKSTRNVLDYGVKNDGTDTENTLNALPGGYTYVFPSGTYAVKGFVNNWYAGFKPKNNTKYIFLPGAKLKVLTNNSPIYSGVYINNIKNFELVNITIEGDRINHDFSEGGSQEFGHGIYLEGASIGEINNPTVYDTTGDGIDVLCTIGSDLRIIYPTITNVRRNGISVESVDKVLIDVPKIDGTNGISPEAGIDIEPWTDTAVMNDVIIRQATCTNNNGAGLSISSLNRCQNGYHVRIDKPILDGLKLGHAISSLKGTILIDNPHIKGGKIGINIQSKPNATIRNPIIEIDPSKIDYTNIPSPVYFYDGSTSGGEVGEINIENADIRNTGNSLHPVYFGRVNVKNVNITFKRCDLTRAIMWDNSSPRNYTNVNIGMLPIAPAHLATGIPIGGGVYIKRKITNKGATTEALFRVFDPVHLTPIAEFEFEVVSPFRMSISSSASYIIYPYGKSVVYSDQVGSRMKLKYGFDVNGNGAFFVTETVGTWIGT